MRKFEIIISNATKDLTKLIKTSDKDETFNPGRHTFSFIIITTAKELAIEIIKLRESVGSRSGTKWLQSCLLTRYLFELVANQAVLKFAPEPESNWERYLYLRNLQIFGNQTYGVALDILPDKTRKKLKKNNAETYFGWNHGDDKINQNKKESVKIENEHFQFNDPWGLTMFEKMKFIKTSHPDVFLSRWRMYSQIAHASSFSLWPMWIDPIPHHDAIQCISIIFQAEYDHLRKEFDGKYFCTALFDSLK